ncbi:MAG: hypothetical protein R2851_02205 [Caldilineaceae bacterium]
MRIGAWCRRRWRRTNSRRRAAAVAAMDDAAVGDHAWDTGAQMSLTAAVALALDEVLTPHVSTDAG